MKIAIVTWVTYNNYGTQLQAFALQNFLNNNGYNAEFLCDKSIVEEHKNKLQANSQPISTVESISKNNFPFLNDLKAILNHCIVLFDKIKWKINGIVLQPYFSSQKKINEFKSQHLAINYGLSAQNLEVLNNKYDIFICGSDQIWSPLDVNFNGYYYLNFVKKTKISYATSLGTQNISKDKLNTIKTWLEDYYAISVRESQSAKQLALLTGKNIEFVCDPTLLFDYKFWYDFCKNGLIVEKKYVFCYFLENKKWYFDFTKRFAKKNGLSIVLLPSKIEYLKTKICLRTAVGPVDFISLIKNSQFVLTDSYHASIFSIIFSKQFFYLKRFDDNAFYNQNLRIESLFELLGIKERFVNKSCNPLSNINEIDYNNVKEKLDSFRKKSQEFLITNIVGSITKFGENP